MLSEAMTAALNKQINYELNAAYHYLAMSAHCQVKNLPGFASWMMRQADEEMVHAMKIYDYVNDRDAAVELQALGKPTGSYDSMLGMFKAALALEKANTKAINELYAKALEENDYATQSMLKWFIDEQVEEESSMSAVIGMLEMAGDNPSALLMLNQQLGERPAESAAGE